MPRLTLRTRLIAVTLLSAFAVLLVALVADRGIRHADESIDLIGEVRMPAVVALAHLDEGRGLVRAANLDATRSADPKALTGAIAQRDAAWRQVDESIATWRKLPLDPGAETGWRDFEGHLAQWRRGEEDLHRMLVVLADGPGSPGPDGLAGARNRLASLDGHYAATTAALDRLLDHEKEAARAEVRNAQRDVEVTRARMLATGLVALAAVLAANLLLVRGVMRALGGEPAEAAAAARRIAEGDLVSGVPVKAGDTTSLMAAMGAMREKLSGIVARINGASESIQVASREIAAGNQDLAQRTEEQAASLEETASSMEELTAAVRQSTLNSSEADRLAADASKQASEGGAVVGQVVRTMSEINESSRKISDIISVIDGIAFQTNILALNAAVEAARAGEQGRGFAVVATEVRALAGRSAEAAKEIKGLIGASVEKVEGGTQLVAKAGGTIDGIVQVVQRVSQTVTEITASSTEQASGIEQVNQAVAQMDQVTQQNAALVEQASAAAESMKKQAEALRRLVAVFRVEGGVPGTPAATGS